MCEKSHDQEREKPEIAGLGDGHEAEFEEGAIVAGAAFVAETVEDGAVGAEEEVVDGVIAGGAVEGGEDGVGRAVLIDAEDDAVVVCAAVARCAVEIAVRTDDEGAEGIGSVRAAEEGMENGEAGGAGFAEGKDCAVIGSAAEFGEAVEGGGVEAGAEGEDPVVGKVGGTVRVGEVVERGVLGGDGIVAEDDAGGGVAGVAIAGPGAALAGHAEKKGAGAVPNQLAVGIGAAGGAVEGEERRGGTCGGVVGKNRPAVVGAVDGGDAVVELAAAEKKSAVGLPAVAEEGGRHGAGGKGVIDGGVVAVGLDGEDRAVVVVRAVDDRTDDEGTVQGQIAVMGLVAGRIVGGEGGEDSVVAAVRVDGENEAVIAGAAGCGEAVEGVAVENEGALGIGARIRTTGAGEVEKDVDGIGTEREEAEQGEAEDEGGAKPVHAGRYVGKERASKKIREGRRRII